MLIDILPPFTTQLGRANVRALDLAAKQGLPAIRKVVRDILKDIPARSRLLIPEMLAPVATVALVLKARSKRIVPVWWDGKSYQLFPRGN